MTLSVLDRFSEAQRPGARLTVVNAGGEDSIAYEELFERAQRAAAGLTARGLGAGDCVAVLAAASIDFFTGCLASWDAGLAVLPVGDHGRLQSQAQWASGANELMRAASARCLLTSRPKPRGVELPVVGIASLAAGGSACSGGSPDAPALILSTSGTTGAPKGIVVSYGTFARRLESHLSEDAVTVENASYLSWRPLHQSAGLNNGFLRPFALGAPTTVMAPHLVVADPLRWLAEISERRITHSGASHFAYRLTGRALEGDQESRLDLSCWRVAFDTGEAVIAGSAARFVEAAARHGFGERSIVPRYSMAEAGLVTMADGGLVIDRVDRAALQRSRAAPADGELAARFVNLGSPRSDVELRIESSDGGELAERGVGEIVVRTDRLADGFLDGRTLRADEWFHTGDLGYMARGSLYVTGRVKDVIIVNGRNHFADDVEQVVAAVSSEGSGEVAVFGGSRSGREGIVIVAGRGEASAAELRSAEKAVRLALWRQLGLTVLDVVYVDDGSLPHTGSGKLSRAAVKTAYETGRLSLFAPER